MRVITITGLLLCLGAAGCSEKPKPSTVQTRDERVVEIAKLESKFNPSDFSERATQAQADILVKRYRDFVNMNPRDSLSPHYLYKAARLSVGLEHHDACIAYLDRIIKDFDSHPGFDQLPQVMLFKAFVFEVYLNNHAMASASYEAMIARFPNHPLSEDARAARDNLNLSEEALLEKLKHGQKGV